MEDRTTGRALEGFAQPITSAAAIKFDSLYKTWEPGKQYTPMTILIHGTHENGDPKLYQVMQLHTSQADWLPSNTPALYKGIGFTVEGVAVWVQPQGGHDAYQVGAIVSHNGQQWINNTANNVWEPGVYGWDLKA